MKREARGHGRALYTHIAPPLLLLCAVVVGWYVATRGGGLPRFILPSPRDVVSAMWGDRALLLAAMLRTLGVSLIGLVSALVIALLAAMAMDLLPFFFRMSYPFIVLSQTIQILAVAPLIVIWFGFGVRSTLIVIVLFCFFPINIALMQGLTNTPREYLLQFRAMRSTKWHIWRYCRFPSALPSFFAGLRIATAYAVISATIGEWVGASRGLGVYLLRAKNALRTAEVFGAMLICSLLSMLLFAVVVLCERAFVPWYFQSGGHLFNELKTKNI